MERRTFLAMVSGSLLAAPLAAEAQQAAKIPRIGWLALANNPAAATHLLEAFVKDCVTSDTSRAATS